MVGLTRVSFVRVQLGGETPVCQLVGTCHRRMVVRSIPLEAATALMARGVPSVVRHLPVDRPVPAPT